MTISKGQFKLLGESGHSLPPIIFGAAPLGNMPRVIPEQRKLKICVEWLRSVDPPIFVEVAYRNDDGLALEMLGRLLRRLDVDHHEIVILLTTNSDRPLSSWENSCRLLGDPYRPQLISIEDPVDNTMRFVNEIKQKEEIVGIGVTTSELKYLNPLTTVADWVVLTHGFSLMRHPPNVMTLMALFRDRDIPIIVRGVFEQGFLLGGNRLDDRIVSIDNPKERSYLTWRTSFVALCHGHGVTPAHACVQFALSGPSVAAVLLTTAHSDRVAENVNYTQRTLPDAFWTSLKEEGLLATNYPI